MSIKIAIIGAGNLGMAIANGLIRQKAVAPGNLYLTRNKIEKLQSFKEQGVQVMRSNVDAVKSADCIILTTKPYNIDKVIQEVKQVLDPKRHCLISAATGITLASIEQSLEQSFPIFRAMPNTAAAVDESVTCICHKNASEELANQVHDLFSAIGVAVTINEELMEAATVLGACGIAYVCRFIRAMVQGGIEIGFDANTANLIATQTTMGATKLLLKNESHPEEEIDKVTTPKGCTIAGLNEMEHQGFSSALIKGILTSFNKIDKS